MFSYDAICLLKLHKTLIMFILLVQCVDDKSIKIIKICKQKKNQIVVNRKLCFIKIIITLMLLFLFEIYGLVRVSN